MGTGSIDTDLQRTCHQPVGQPVQLAVTQEAVTLNETVEEMRHVVYITALAEFVSESVWMPGTEGFERCVCVSCICGLVHIFRGVH